MEQLLAEDLLVKRTLILYNRASCWNCTFKVGEKWFFPSVHDAVVGCLRHQKVGPSCKPSNLKHLGARTWRVHLNIDVSWCFRQCYSSLKQTRAVTYLIHGTCRFPVSKYRANMRWILGHAEESPVWQAKRKLYATRSVCKAQFVSIGCLDDHCQVAKSSWDNLQSSLFNNVIGKMVFFLPFLVQFRTFWCLIYTMPPCIELAFL